MGGPGRTFFRECKLIERESVGEVFDSAINAQLRPPNQVMKGS